MPRTNPSRPLISSCLPLKIAAALLACALFLIIGTIHPSAQQQPNGQSRPKRCLVCVEVTPTPTPTPTPDPTLVYEKATNCDLVPGVQLNKDETLVKCRIAQGTHFKVKASSTISSANTREGDFVGFEVAEEVRSSVIQSFQRGRVVISKALPAFGVVIKRKHRHFPMVNGKLNVSLGAVRANDGTPVPIFIDRFKCPGCLHCLFEKSQKCENVCPWSKDPKGGQPDLRCGEANPSVYLQYQNPYVSGRADRNVAVVVQALAATALAFVKEGRDNATEKAFILFTLANQAGIGELLNGTDAQIQANDVFDAYVLQDTDIILSVGKVVLTQKYGGARR